MSRSFDVPYPPAVVRAPVIESERGPLVALALAALLPALGTSIAHVGLPVLAVEFAAPFQTVQWVVIAYLLVVTALVVVAGRLGDLVGRKRLLLTGIAVFTVASIACGLVSSLPLLIAARAIQGLGAAAMMALAMAMVGDAIPRQRIGRAMGVMGTLSAVGTALGPSLGGLLLSVFGWRAMFVAMVPMGVVAFAISARFLKADHVAANRPPVPFDIAGMVMLAVALGMYSIAMTTIRGPLSWINGALLAASATAAFAFVLIEAKTTSPLVRIAILRDRALASGFSSSALVSTVIMSTLVVGPFYVSRALGLEPALVGLVVAIGPVVAAVAAVPAGRLVDRHGAHRTMIAGLVGVAGGCVGLAALPVSAGIAGYVLPIVIITAGYSLFQTSNNAAVMTNVAVESRGVVSGLLNLSRNLGLVTGAAVMGAVFASGARGTDIAIADGASVARGMHHVFTVASVLIVITLTIVSRSRTPVERAVG